jgi:hypothetical protein
MRQISGLDSFSVIGRLEQVNGLDILNEISMIYIR